MVETLKDKVEEGYDVGRGVPGQVGAKVSQEHSRIMAHNGAYELRRFDGVPKQIQEIVL